MSELTAEIVICGAGIAGISTAYYLTQQGMTNIVLVDERPPLTLTSDKSTECYRNWWPDAPMVRFMNRSIDLLDNLARESDNIFRLNRRGYAFCTADSKTAVSYQQSGRNSEAFGGGPLRIYHNQPGDLPLIPIPPEGFENQPDGADLLLDRELILREYPFINPDVVAMIRPRRCGSLSAQQLGMYLLEQVKTAGVRLINGRISAITTTHNQITAVHLTHSPITTIHAPRFVNAAGPYIKQVGQLMGLDLPVFNELHGKISIKDTLGIVPRHLPLMIWDDPITLPWSEDERADLAADPQTAWLAGQLPAGVHFKTEGEGGSNILVILWTYHLEPHEPIWPPKFDAEYPEIVMRGITQLVPGLSVYLEKMERPYLDGGYYCKTRENRLLACPLPVNGAYLIGALSGYGIMASQAAAELLACYITGSPLPDYAPAFHLNRYQDPAYLAWMSQVDATSGQL